LDSSWLKWGCKYFHPTVSDILPARARKKPTKRSHFLPESAPDPGAVFGDPPKKRVALQGRSATTRRINGTTDHTKKTRIEKF
jgi:hypothetical protein